MIFATTTGSEWINAPYVIHVSAPTPCTRRSVVGLRQKYETANSTVASHPIQSAFIGGGQVRARSHRIGAAGAECVSAPIEISAAPACA